MGQSKIRFKCEAHLQTTDGSILEIDTKVEAVNSKSAHVAFNNIISTYEDAELLWKRVYVLKSYKEVAPSVIALPAPESEERATKTEWWESCSLGTVDEDNAVPLYVQGEGSD